MFSVTSVTVNSPPEKPERQSSAAGVLPLQQTAAWSRSLHPPRPCLSMQPLSSSRITAQPQWASSWAGGGGTQVSSVSEKEQEFQAQVSEWMSEGLLCPRLAPQARNLQ